MNDEYKDDLLEALGAPAAVHEFEVIGNLIRALAVRNAGHAQHLVALVVSNFAAGDGFDVVLDSYGSATTVEIVGTDGRRLVIAPLANWSLEGAPWGEAWEWGIRGTDGSREACSTTDDQADVWGSDDVGIDLARAIDFYRRAIDDVCANEGFVPCPAPPLDAEVLELVNGLGNRA